jgi:hypothetical protein
MNEKTESLTPLDRFPEVAGALTAIYLKLKESGLLIPGILHFDVSRSAGSRRDRPNRRATEAPSGIQGRRKGLDKRCSFFRLGKQFINASEIVNSLAP